MTHIVVENNGQTLYILEATVDDKGMNFEKIFFFFLLLYYFDC